MLHPSHTDCYPDHLHQEERPAPSMAAPIGGTFFYGVLWRKWCERGVGERQCDTSPFAIPMAVTMEKQAGEGTTGEGHRSTWEGCSHHSAMGGGPHLMNHGAKAPAGKTLATVLPGSCSHSHLLMLIITREAMKTNVHQSPV